MLEDGGVFCGHDYDEQDWPDVTMEVDRLVGPVKVVDHIWSTEP